MGRRIGSLTAPAAANTACKEANNVHLRKKSGDKIWSALTPTAASSQAPYRGSWCLCIECIGDVRNARISCIVQYKNLVYLSYCSPLRKARNTSDTILAIVAALGKWSLTALLAGPQARVRQEYSMFCRVALPPSSFENGHSPITRSQRRKRSLLDEPKDFSGMKG